VTGSARRPTLRSVGMPAEHGGWGLTLEPGILGVLIAPSLAGLFLAVAALLALLLRTPLRLVLIDRQRDRARPRTTLSLERTRLATRVAGIELVAIAVALGLAALLAQDPRWWLPLVIAAPLLVMALWFDMRSMSRHIVPEIAGSVAIAGVAAAGALAGGAPWPLAIGAWVILGGRVFSSIPHVRAQVSRIHGRPVPAAPSVLGDLAAVVTAIAALWLDPALGVGALALVGVIVIQRITLLRPPRPAKVLGVRQMILGFTVVGATAAGSWLL
jgi:hypothetical protein